MGLRRWLLGAVRVFSLGAVRVFSRGSGIRRDSVLGVLGSVVPDAANDANSGVSDSWRSPSCRKRFIPCDPPCENPTRSRDSVSLSITPASVVAHLSSHAHCPVALHREYAPSPSLRPSPLLQRLTASFGMGRAGFVEVLPDAVVLPAAVVVRPPYLPSVLWAFRPASGHAVPQRARMGRMA